MHGRFHQARFGMFIHWGVYSVLAGNFQGRPIPGIGEWIMQAATIPVDEFEPLPASLTHSSSQPTPDSAPPKTPA